MSAVYKCGVTGEACEFACFDGSCKDGLYEDFGLCSVKGDNLPAANLPGSARRVMAEQQMRGERKTNG